MITVVASTFLGKSTPMSRGSRHEQEKFQKGCSVGELYSWIEAVDLT